MRVTIVTNGPSAAAATSDLHAALVRLAKSGEVESIDVDGSPIILERVDLHSASTHHQSNPAGDRHNVNLTVHAQPVPKS